MKLFLYQRVKKYVSDLDTVSAAVLQRKFKIGYGKAVEMLQRLEDDGRITHSNGKWHVLRGARDNVHNGYPAEITYAPEEPEEPRVIEEFTEENVIKLLDQQNCISTSLLQRRFRVGYGRAASMMDTLAEKGYIEHDGQRWTKIK
jgi:DNA segregation ATPase FtsK/SpoIIIE-like protein